MASPVLNYFPQSFTAGDTVRIRLSFGDYPANGGWSAALKLNKPGADVVSVIGSADSDGFIFVITATASAKMIAGLWTWAARVTNGTDVKTAQGGSFTLLPNYSATIEKSVTQLQLDAANSAFQKLMASPRTSVNFNGQNFSYSNRLELLNIIDRLQSKIDGENAEVAGLLGDVPTRSIRPYFV